MNELLAIIAIVLVCCAMFFAWLFSMATCPDRMVNLISGSSSSQQGCSSNGSSSASKELINTKFTDSPSPDNVSEKESASKTSSRASSTVSSLLNRLNSQKSGTNKKLSVVPEADEQLTVTSISQCRTPTSPQQAPQQRASILPNSQCRIIMEESVCRTNEEEVEDRCVEDVINRRRKQLVQQTDGWTPGGTDPRTADVTPVPSRCPSKPSSIAEEMAPLYNGQLGSSAPAIVHLL